MSQEEFLIENIKEGVKNSKLKEGQTAFLLPETMIDRIYQIIDEAKGE